MAACPIPLQGHIDGALDAPQRGDGPAFNTVKRRRRVCSRFRVAMRVFFPASVTAAVKGDLVIVVKIEPISANEGCTGLWKSEIHFDGIFEGLGVQPHTGQIPTLAYSSSEAASARRS